MTTETRTYTITASPSVLARFERLLALFHFASGWGHSGCFGMSLDGDGPERLQVEPEPRQYRKGVGEISNVGYDVELATDRGFAGLFEDSDRMRRWRYSDDGERLK